MLYSLRLLSLLKACCLFANICSSTGFFTCKVEHYLSLGSTKHSYKLGFRKMLTAPDASSFRYLLKSLVILCHYALISILQPVSLATSFAF